MTGSQASAGLVDSERRFQLLINAVTDYAIYMLDPDGYINSWNSGAQRIKGYTAEEVIGQHFSRFYTPEDRATGLPAHALTVAAREGRFEREGWRVRKDGTRFWANVVIDPIRDETGTLIGFAKVTRDITEKKETEAALELARAEAHQSQKLAAVAQLAAGIAHDFNNLLTVVMGNLDLLKRAREERRPRLIDNALLAVEEARKLTSKLLAFSRRQPLFPEPVDLNAMIAGMDDMLNQSLRGDINLEFDLTEGLWPVEIDRSQFQVALINLAVNARDAMPKGGTFRIRSENTVLHDPDRKEVVAVSISDTGTGIPPESCPRSSSRSSPPRKSAREQASDWRKSTASQNSRAVPSTSAARSAAARRSPSICRNLTRRCEAARSNPSRRRPTISSSASCSWRTMRRSRKSQPPC